MSEPAGPLTQLSRHKSAEIGPNQSLVYAQRVSVPVVMPLFVATRLAHATVQSLADPLGCDVLHIKGPAVDESLLDVRKSDGTPVARRSTDADIWVNPRQVDRLVSTMHKHGWSTLFRFEDGSPFEHASTMVHPILGYVDVHRAFPGIGVASQQAFDQLWRDRQTVLIAGRPCSVPSLAAQRLILILHAARHRVIPESPDIRRTWHDAGPQEREELLQLARVLQAEVALAAGTGRLEEFRGRRDYRLWKLLSSGGHYSLFAMWVARIRAARGPREAVRTAFRLVLPKRQRLAVNLGRPPTRREVVTAYLDQLKLVRIELSKVLKRRSR